MRKNRELTPGNLADGTGARGKEGTRHAGVRTGNSRLCILGGGF
ncbi:hypothetical protein [Kroppenstedtia pulmonis]|nr:hypothetical protein [Kroppenstedtia pulmonis]